MKIIWIPSKYNKGLVCIRDYEANEAMDNNDDLMLKCEGDVMTIKNSDIRKRIRFSRGPYTNQGRTYNLVYFWFTRDKLTDPIAERKRRKVEKQRDENSKKWDEYNKMSPEEQNKFRLSN